MLSNFSTYFYYSSTYRSYPFPAGCRIIDSLRAYSCHSFVPFLLAFLAPASFVQDTARRAERKEISDEQKEKVLYKASKLLLASTEIER